MPETAPLIFKVAPHIVEDLGLNLYTSLPRVLVEFIANAYDADSPDAHVRIDKERVGLERRLVKVRWEAAKLEAAHSGKLVPRLEEMTLPDDLAIEIEDRGHGMSREDLADKFLVAGRRRRGRDNSNTRSPGKRILMGRKGLGKLAGFGIAKVIKIVTRAAGETHATQIILRFDDLISVSQTNAIPIEESRLEDGGGIDPHGTRVVLSRLLYEPFGTRLTTIEHQAADHFTQIDPADFQIVLNGEIVQPTPRAFAYAWPDPQLAADDVVDAEYEVDDGRKFKYTYRLRFVLDRHALPAKERGIRVYAHKRLAAGPSLLDADTNMHGFRMTDYLDGSVYADFIDDQPEDYVATDRQSLRWESPLLAPMYEQLSLAIKNACYARQKERDSEKDKEVEKDPFTNAEITKAELSKREEQVARKIATAISSLHKQGFQDDGYKTQFHEVIDALGRGELLTALASLAREEKPEFDRVVAEVTRLTSEQLDGFYKYAKARIDGIAALRKIVMSVDFKNGKNEKVLHGLLKVCPWLINPTYFEFLTSDQTERTMFKQIEKELKVDEQVNPGYNSNVPDETDAGGTNERPDLVFLLGNSALSRLVIVELKAPNTPLYGAHYRQLQGYVRRAEKWLTNHGKQKVGVEGLLIGSFANVDNRAEDVEWLNVEIEKLNEQSQCRVYGIDKILELAQDAHKELLDLWGKSHSS